MTEPLFCHFDLRETLKQIEQTMLKEIRSLSESRTLNSSHEDLCKHFVGKYSVEMPEINEEGITADYGDAQINVSGRFEYMVRDGSRPFLTTGTRVTFYVPFTGDGQLFHCSASTRSLNPPRAVISNNELQFVYERTTNDAERIPDEFQSDLTRFKQCLSWTAKTCPSSTATSGRK